MRTMPALWLLLAVTCGRADAAPTAHLRGPEGEWREVPIQREDGRLTIALTPAQIPNGRARLVINKPAWMRLHDSSPPMLLALRVGEDRVPLEDALDLGVFDGPIPPITARIGDDMNPLDPRSFRLKLQGLPAKPVVDASGVTHERTTGEFIVRLPTLAPGAYRGELVVADLSPQANTLRLPCKLSVFGVEISEGDEPVRLATASASYSIAANPRLPLVIGADGPQAYLTGQIAGNWMYALHATSTQMIADTADRKLCRITTDLGTADGKPLDLPGSFEFDLEVRRDLPCLIVRSRCRNEMKDGDVYAFWGWLPGAGFETRAGRHQWKMVYESVGEVGWVYLPAEREGAPGIGWISPLPFGESRFGTMLLYTSPTRIPTKKGEAVEMAFAIMPASSAGEVAATAARLDELGVWEEER